MSEVKYKICSKCGGIMSPNSGGWICNNCGAFETTDGKIYPTRIDIAPHSTNSFDWQAFRAEAAKAAMVACLKEEADGAYPDPEEVCGMAVLYADELIRLLKDETQG